MGSNSEVKKNDKAWGELFEKCKIIENIERNGYFEITARQILDITGREPRLMAKFDHRINLPKPFSSNNLSILPITRGSYIIASFEAYKNFELLDNEITRVSFPEHIESINYENITSEAMAINCAYVSNILADFLGDEELKPTVSGRMSSGVFSFYILVSKSSFIEVNVVNSQIEIDGGYEGIKQLAIIEAKNFISNDFLIRQLYYPYRLWKDKVTKKITPVFLVYSNGIYSLYEYEFQETNNYNSLTLIRQKNYSIEAIEIDLDSIFNILHNVKIIEEPQMPFPQANSFKRIINLCELLSRGEMTKDDITLNYDFDPRQTNYYTDAGRYLGLISKYKKNNGVLFFLTEEGKKIIRSTYVKRQLKFVETILRHMVFNEVLKRCFQLSEMPSKREIVQIMKKSRLHQVGSESTFYRRSSTIIGWINWILDLPR